MLDDRSPNARTIGVVFLLYFVVGSLSGFLSKGLVHSGDAAATANNLLAHESLFRAGFAVDLVANAIYIVLTVLFYRLFAGVNRNLSLIAAVFSLVGCTVQIVGSLLRLAPLVILKDSPLQHVFPPEQLQALALQSFELYRQVFNISFVLFGFSMLTLGYLIYQSKFLPRFLGLWMMCGGMGSLMFLWPPLAKQLWPAILALDLSEAALMLWLIVKGVDKSHWREQESMRQHAG